MSHEHEAVLMLSFGGPRKSEEIRPFLANVTRGKAVHPQKLEAVVQHYELIGGSLPLTDLTRHQSIKLHDELRARGYDLPVDVGMRHWHPFIGEALANIAHQGRSRIVGLIMSTHRCTASWEQYQEDVATALETVEVDIQVDFTEPIHDHPGFIEAQADLTDRCLARIATCDRSDVMLVFTAHSIPVHMAEQAGYVEQFERSAQAVTEKLGHDRWTCAYQSRSGRPTDPWLEPDISEAIGNLGAQGIKDIAIVPIGFVCDHVEILYDLDMGAMQASVAAGIRQYRVATLHDHPRYIDALVDSVLAVATT